MGLNVRDDSGYAAQMTNNQFEALSCRLEFQRVCNETRSLLVNPYFAPVATYDAPLTQQLLVNGWSTEYAMRVVSDNLQGDAKHAALHWAFPQAYYSIFSVASAYYTVTKQTDAKPSHVAVIKKFGELAEGGKYPDALSCTITGGSTASFVHKGLQCTALSQSIRFDPTNADYIDGQIAQFLRATREHDLKEKRKAMNFKKADGKPKLALNGSDWTRVSDKIGTTSLMSLLYRKRIKANYRDIDTFLHTDVQPDVLLRNLHNVVASVNFVHEAMLARTLGIDFLKDVIRTQRSIAASPMARLGTISAIL